MLSIGLTGGYATGKSTAAGILRDLGAVVVDADELSHAVIRRGEPGWQEVVEVFGPEIVAADGEIDRAALGRLAFGQPELRAKLERIIHPKVLEILRRERERALLEGAAVFICEAPLLFEAGVEREFDRVWVVAASPTRQLARAVARDGLSADEVRTRVDAQMSLAEKVRRADVVLWNDEDPPALRRRIEHARGREGGHR